jgi:iron complex outermembrane receptor protein
MNQSASANVSSQTKITLNLRSAEFKQVLSTIESQSDYRFMFSNRNIPSNSKLDISVKDAQISTVMDMILNNSGYTYQELANNLIVIMPSGARLNAVKITGKVLDQTGETLIGASIKIKGTSEGVTTDENGAFTISVPDDAVLVISFVGFKTQEIPVAGKTTLNITLQPNEKMMSEVVVTALGIRREQKALGYAVSTVTSEQINASGNTNFASALYGKAAGVKITTAPGGATSAVNIQIRGVNSLNYNTQPLYVVDGVQIRNNNESGGMGGNTSTDYWGDQRIRGNGILDINPTDIENLTVLKGASATALYGSDASSGVVVITTKKGSKSRGLGVDVNYSATAERIAFAPQYQNIYGPGSDRAGDKGSGANAEGWVPVGTDGTTVRPRFSSSRQFGPKMDGRMVPWWDGSMHPYSPQPDNYKQMFQKGYNSNLNVSLSNMNDKANYRFSFTRSDYKGIQIGGGQQRNTFNLNSTIKLHSKISLDVVGGYVNTTITNRPYQMNRIFDAYDGFFSRAEDMAVVFDKYKTTQGYKYVAPGDAQRNPDEALAYPIKYELMNLLWTQLRNTETEKQDRLLSSVTLNLDLAKGLKFRTRIGNDFTSLNTERREYNEYPVAFNAGRSTGLYGVSKGRYSIVYGDLLATYANDPAKDFGYSVSAGTQARKENFTDQNSFTSGGLVTANWFSINNSYNQQSTAERRSGLLKYAYLGILNLSYKGFLFLEGTARQEYSSTLPPGSNSYFYPSANASFILTEALHLPRFINYGKVRASYGLVGNAPPPFESNVTYTQRPLPTTTGSVPVLVAQSAYGNEGLKSEKKTETEVGFETKMFNSLIGLDVSYYDSKVTDLLMRLAVAASNGATTRITNVGKLHSTGLEIAFNATPVSRKVKWTTRLNFAFNSSTVEELTPGVNQIVFKDFDQQSLHIVAEVGQPIGNIYIYPRMKDDKGNEVVGPNGVVLMDKTKYVKVGNILPKVVGGFSNTVSYRNLSLDFMLDYRFGGDIASPPQKYAKSAGMYTNTLQYRDEQHGGLPYYVNAAGVSVPLESHNSASPNGPVYHDGVIVPGVNQDGSPNTRIIQAASYYVYQFDSSADGDGMAFIYKNNYIKLRELVLGYNVSKTFANKLHFQNLRVSLIGRNLLYVYRTMKNLDPEAPLGGSWMKQGIDEGSTGATRSFGFSVNASF